MVIAEIITYSDVHKERVKELNYEWLKKYELWEPLDDEYLNNPQGMILDKGGHIFLASLDDEIIGTVALLPHGEECMEVCKLAVDEQMRGRKIGRLLMEKCIEASLTAGAKKVILYSSSKLQTALELYKKMGFVPVDDVNYKYEQADIKMELRIGT